MLREPVVAEIMDDRELPLVYRVATGLSMGSRVVREGQGVVKVVEIRSCLPIPFSAQSSPPRIGECEAYPPQVPREAYPEGAKWEG